MEALIPALYWLSRFLHVGTAIVLLGGSVFMRFALIPAAKAALDEAHHLALRDQVIARWRKFVHIGAGLLVITGGFNYARVIIEKTHAGDGLYHALVGTKMILGLALLALASVLVGRSHGAQKMREQAATWLLRIILLGGIIVAMSSLAKQLPVKAPVATSSPTPSTTTP